METKSIIKTEKHIVEWWSSGSVLLQAGKTKIEMMIDGVSGFLFLDGRGKPMLAYQWEKKFQRSVEKYNKIYKVELPKITPHICRHTYCTNMAKSGTSVKTLQDTQT